MEIYVTTDNKTYFEMNYRCLFCHTRAFEDKIKEAPISEDVKNSIVEDFYHFMAEYGTAKSAPEAASYIYGLIRKKTGIRLH